MPSPIESVSVYLMPSQLPADCAPQALLEATAEGLRKTQRFGTVQTHEGPGVPVGYRVGVRIGTMTTVFGEMPQVELLLIDPSGVLLEEVEPMGTKVGIPHVAGEIALQFADEALYPVLTASDGNKGREHPRVRYFNPKDCALMGVALLQNLRNQAIAGVDHSQKPLPGLVKRITDVGERTGDFGMWHLALQIVDQWGEPAQSLVLLKRALVAVRPEEHHELAARFRGTAQQLVHGPELAALLIHFGAPSEPGSKRREAILRWLRSRHVPLRPDDLRGPLERAYGVAWSWLPGLGGLLTSSSLRPELPQALGICRPALQVAGLLAEAQALEAVATDAAAWKGPAKALLAKSAALTPLLTLEPWWNYHCDATVLGKPAGRALLESALAAAPDSVVVLEQLGIERDMAGDKEGSLQALNRAIELAPTCAVLYGNRGGAHSDSGRLEEALRDLDRAIELEPVTPLFHAHRARTLRKAGRLDDALAAAERAVQVEPTNLDALAMRCELRMDHQRYAEVAADPALVNHRWPEVQIQRGIAHFHLGNAKGALAALAAGIDGNPTAEAFFFRARANAAEGNLEAAERDLTQLIRGNVPEPMQSDCAKLLAEVQARRGTLPAARTSAPKPPEDKRPWWQKLFG
jgi:tetratricopeptide (TPR) repeat protein